MSSERIEALKARLEKVRLLYERYFAGLEKRMPIRERESVARDIRRFIPGSDAVARFQHRNLVQRLVVLEQYWGRIIRGIESGTLKRESARADYRIQNRQQQRDVAQAPPQASPDESAEAAAFLGTLKTEGPKIKMRGPARSTKASTSPKSES